jgi:hypothetical protein
MSDANSDQYVYDLLAELESRIDDLEAENERLRERVNDLDAKTDIMEIVDEVDDMSGRERSVRIIQHLHRKVQRHDHDRAALTRDQVEECLHHPDVARSTIYSDMRRCERLIGDESVCWYAGDGVGARDETAIVLDLDGAELAGEFRAGGDE